MLSSSFLSRGLLLISTSCFFACSSSDSSGGPTSDAGTDTAVESRTICLVTDVPGDFDDRSYVASAFAGVQQAKTKYGWRVVSVSPDPGAAEEGAKKFREKLEAVQAKENCTLLVALGAFYGSTVAEVSKLHPAQKYQVLDFAPEPPLTNVWGQTYSVAQATFLAGYLSAAVSTTKRVGVIGGLNVAPIQEFLDGYALGVKYYNEKHGTSVEVLGWDPKNRTTGAFIDSFTDTEKAKAKANELLAAGADIIFPVAGGAGYGAGEAVIVRGSALVIGVDVDWGAQAAYENVTLTSVLKRLDRSVGFAVDAIVKNEFAGGSRPGTLQSTDVDIAPFHKLESRVPDALRTELEGVRAQIIAGTVKTVP
jgi:basic membrane protein A and related proteins